MPSWIHKMKRGGVRNPHALLSAAGYEEGDSDAEAKRKLSSYMKARKWLRRRQERSS